MADLSPLAERSSLSSGAGELPVACATLGAEPFPLFESVTKVEPLSRRNKSGIGRSRTRYRIGEWDGYRAVFEFDIRKRHDARFGAGCPMAFETASGAVMTTSGFATIGDVVLGTGNGAAVWKGVTAIFISAGAASGIGDVRRGDARWLPIPALERG